MRPLNKNSGFTLIEMAVVIMIVGILVAGGSKAYDIYRKDMAVQSTAARTTAIVTALGTFRNIFGRYPCPASLTATRDDPAYGAEQCPPGGGDPGTCTNGLCTEESPRSITFMSSGTAITEEPLVVSGFIPFRALNLPENFAYDGYDSRLKYVVTYHLTGSENFEADTGGIRIFNDLDETIVEPDGSAHFLIISHGEGKSGAYTRAGVKLPCLAGTPEEDNCAEDRAIAQYRLSQTATANNAFSFDDSVLYFTRSDMPLWQVSEADNVDIHQKPPGDVAFFRSVGSDITAGGYSRDGIVRSRQNIFTQSMCAQDGSDCFSSSLISGPLNPDPADMTDDIKCPPGQYMFRIEGGQAVCQPEIWITCPNQQPIYGFEDGKPICKNSDCGTQPVGICDTIRTLPDGKESEEYTIYAGDNAFKLFRCVNENWTLITDQTDPESCTCTPVTQTQNNSCGAGFTGKRTQTRDFLCPQAEWTNWVDVPGAGFAEKCKCVETTQNRNKKCPTNYTGTIKEQRNHICTGPGAPTWSTWIEVSNTCTCEEKTVQENRDCPSPLSGKYKVERSLSCPSGKWSAWKEIAGQGQADNCKCVTKTESKAKKCPSPKVGEYYITRTLSCPGGTWSNWEEDPDNNQAQNCKDPPKVRCDYNPIGGSNIQDFAMGPPAGTPCECGVDPQRSCHIRSGAVFNNFPACSCR